MEYLKILRHVSTRWLSLLRCVDRLIAAWPAIKSYFLTIGKEECDPIIWQFIKENENELSEDLTVEITLPECYIYFISHYRNVLNESILILEKATVTSIELHDVMKKLKDKI